MGAATWDPIPVRRLLVIIPTKRIPNKIRRHTHLAQLLLTALVSRLLHFARLEALRYAVDDVAHLVHEEVGDGLLVAGVLAAARKAGRSMRHGHASEATSQR